MADNYDFIINEKRQYYRLPCFIEVKFLIKDHVFTGTALNLSVEGIFLETDVKFKIDQKIVLFFSSLDHKNDFQIQGAVKWISNEGVGIKFVKKCLEDDRQIMFLIENATSIII